jgi:mannan endo-1,4-beta-mannosidase
LSSLVRSVRPAAWWASSRGNQRWTLVGAFALVLGLVASGTLVWVMPSTNPVTRVNDLIREATGPSQLDLARAQLAELTSKLTDRGRELGASRADTLALEEQLQALQQQVWTLEGELQSQQAASADRESALQAQLDGARGATGSGGFGGSGSSGSGAPVAPTPDWPEDQGPDVVAPAPITAPAKAELVAPQSRYFGMYTQQSPFNWAEVDATSRTIGSTPNLAGYFGGFDGDFRADAVERSWQRGMLPLLTWESRPLTAANDVVEEPDYRLSKIIDGGFDDYLRKYARDIRATGLPLAIRLNHEMNGDWYPWSEQVNGNSPGQYAESWRHIHDIFEEEGANDLVVWIWAPNRIDRLGATAQTLEHLAGLYPGDEYVDWVGMSGYLRPPYNSSTQFTFEETFTRTLTQLRTVSDKPILLAEIGASEIGDNKPHWIRSLFKNLTLPENADVIGFSWFNLAVSSRVQGEMVTNDWRITSRATSSTAFREGLLAPGSGFVARPPK